MAVDDGVGFGDAVGVADASAIAGYWLAGPAATHITANQIATVVIGTAVLRMLEPPRSTQRLVSQLCLKQAPSDTVDFTSIYDRLN